MENYDVESCMEVLLEHAETRDQAADILDKLESIMLKKKGWYCCEGVYPLFWMDVQNNAFFESRGVVLVTAKDKTLRFKVDCCPKCGRKFGR